MWHVSDLQHFVQLGPKTFHIEPHYIYPLIVSGGETYYMNSQPSLIEDESYIVQIIKHKYNLAHALNLVLRYQPPS